MGDRIDQLPQTNTNPSNLDSEIMNELFSQQEQPKGKIWKYSALLLALFVVLNLPAVNNLLNDTFSESAVLVLSIKTIVFVIVIAILQVVN
jgi:uncharacterized membrane protein YcjF (UPF0283 family)